MSNSSSIELDLPYTEQELSVWVMEQHGLPGSYTSRMMNQYAPYPNSTFRDRIRLHISITQQIKDWATTLQHKFPNSVSVSFGVHTAEGLAVTDTLVCGVPVY
jgi:hypothetical protein